MSTSLNLYATKIFEEHPLALWPLDEDIGYLSLDGSDFGSLPMWSITGATSISSNQLAEELPNLPRFSGASYAQSFQGTSGLITLTSPESFEQSDVSLDLGSIAFGAYIYAPDRSIDVRVGLSYLNGEGEQEVLRATRVDPVIGVPARSRKMWAFVSFTFELPQEFTQLTPFVEVSYEESEVDFQFSLFGFTFGQWAEEFQASSRGVLGSITQDVPATIPVTSDGVKLIEAKQYGFEGNSGYYIAKDNELLAKNTGMPLAFGTENSTVIFPGNSVPSLILPGQGFMNESGKNSQTTFEFWANIQSNATESKRIFGPLTSNDGLYVDRHMLKLKLGLQEVSYSVGEWGRPMLISIRLGKISASVVINGTQVMSAPLDISQYPESSEDWLGFYAHDDVPVVQIESPSLFPYEVPAIVQKRRFVYGQGVDYPTSIKGLNHASAVTFDHSVSNAAKNVSYPSSRPWWGGVSENIDANQSRIATPTYPLPEIYINDTSLDWNAGMQEAFDPSSPSFKIRPTEDFSSTNGYLYFQNFSFLNETLFGIFGVFELTTLDSQKQTLIKLVNDLTSENFEIYLEDGKIKYSLSSIPEPFFEQDSPELNTPFAVGVDFIKSQSFGGRVASFLTATQSLKAFIAGDSSYSTTFGGNIHKISLCSQQNLNMFPGIFSENGLPGTPSVDEIDNALSQNATYTLVGRESLGIFMLDIATHSSWQDYSPVSYFAKNVLGSDNKPYKAVDFLQFNVDYIRLNNFVGDYYDTANLPVKTYISFDYLSNGSFSSKPNSQKLGKSGIVQPGDEWQTTKYEVLNDTIIKFPRGVDRFLLGLTMHIDIDSDGILKDSVSIRSMSISSQALGNQPNKIKTLLGPELVPYKRSGLYFEYKDVSPFSIVKESSPYLHLTKYSGLRPRVPFTNAGIEGVSVPINSNEEEFFKINLLQMSFRYDEPTFPSSPVQLFELQTPNEYLRFYLVADSSNNNRGQIYAIDSLTSTLRSDIVFYINGRITKRPVVTPYLWTTLSMSFLDSLDFSSTPGAFRVTSPILFDNLSYYNQTRDDDVSRFKFRKWSSVRSGLDTTFDWSDWEDSTWQEVLFLTESDAELSDAELVYRTFIGTNSFIFSSDSNLVVNNYRSSIYKDLAWGSSIITPV